MKTVESPADLMTTMDDTTRGFLQQQSLKLKLWTELDSAAQVTIDRITAHGLDGIAAAEADGQYWDFLVGAVMLSSKGRSNLSDDLVRQIIQAGVNFDDLAPGEVSLEYLRILEDRFRATSGATLGGQLRNRIGRMGSDLFTNAVMFELDAGDVSYELAYNKSGKVTSIHWQPEFADGLALVFDRKIPVLDKNVDFILVETPMFQVTDLADHSRILAVGEIKGGIDPAGADEHWKTALTSLDRIVALAMLNPPAVYFLGGVITTNMAKEIFHRLENGYLRGAANLQREEQVAEVAQLLTSLG